MTTGKNEKDNQSTLVGTTRRRGKIKVRKYRNSARPNLKFAVGYREDGKRSQKFFETKEAADTFARQKNAEYKDSGIEHAEFPTWLRIMAHNAYVKLHPFNRTIDDAVAHYVKHLKATERSCSAEQLVEKLLEAKEADGVGERHRNDLASRLGYFADEFDGKLIAEISSAEINEWLRSLDVGPMTRNHYRAVLVQAYNFAIANGYAAENPALKAAKAKVTGEPPGILTVEQASALLVNATPEILPYFAIGMFAGLRRAELERLDWSEVDFESGLIEVKAEKSKTAMRRFVTMQPNLRAWLLPHRKLKGSVTPADDFKELFDHARIAAGINEWPQNALRHSFASYHLAHFKNAAATAMELGHHDSRVTFAHYRELVKPKEAKRYWTLKPAKAEKKIVPMLAR
jgi:integrase